MAVQFGVPVSSMLGRRNSLSATEEMALRAAASRTSCELLRISSAARSTVPRTWSPSFSSSSLISLPVRCASSAAFSVCLFGAVLLGLVAGCSPERQQRSQRERPEPPQWQFSCHAGALPAPERVLTDTSDTSAG